MCVLQLIPVWYHASELYKNTFLCSTRVLLISCIWNKWRSRWKDYPAHAAVYKSPWYICIWRLTLIPITPLPRVISELVLLKQSLNKISKKLSSFGFLCLYNIPPVVVLTQVIPSVRGRGNRDDVHPSIWPVLLGEHYCSYIQSGKLQYQVNILDLSFSQFSSWRFHSSGMLHHVGFLRACFMMLSIVRLYTNCDWEVNEV